MFPRIRLTLLLGAAALLPTAYSESAKPLTNDDVIAMTKAELPESTIILAIQTSPRSFDLGAPSLIALKTAGVSPKVIEAMITPASPGGATAPATTAPSGPTEDEAGMLLQRRSTDESQGAMMLVLFKKLNGRSGAADGIPIYRMDFEAVFGATTDFRWEEQHFGVDFHVRTAKDWLPGGYHASSGSLFRLHGQAQFERTENGWRIRRIEATEDFLYEGSRDVRTCVQTVTDNATIAEVNQRQAEVRRIQEEAARQRRAEEAKANAAREAEEARKKAAMDATREALRASVPPFNKTDLERLLAVPDPAEAILEKDYITTDKKVHVRYPADAKLQVMQNRVLYAYIVLKSGGEMTITRKRGADYKGGASRDICLKSTIEVIRKEDPKAVITEPLDVRISNVDATMIGVTKVEGEKILRIAVAMVVKNDFLVGLVLNSTPDKFEAEFPAFKRLCESCVIEVK